MMSDLIMSCQTLLDLVEALLFEENLGNQLINTNFEFH